MSSSDEISDLKIDDNIYLSTDDAINGTNMPSKENALQEHKSESVVECEALLKEIYDGNYFALPLFAQSLITFLYEGIPDSDNPRIAAEHIAKKGMYLLQKNHELNDNTEKMQYKKYEFKRISRDCFFVILGTAAQRYHYLWSISLVFICLKVFDDYKVHQYRQLFDFAFIIGIAYAWCS